MNYLRQTELGREGLSSRAINALHFLGIDSLAQLKAAQWLPSESKLGLRGELMRSPNCGERTTNDIAAFLEKEGVKDSKAVRPTVADLEARIVALEATVAKLVQARS